MTNSTINLSGLLAEAGQLESEGIFDALQTGAQHLGVSGQPTIAPWVSVALARRMTEIGKRTLVCGGLADVAIVASLLDISDLGWVETIVVPSAIDVVEWMQAGTLDERAEATLVQIKAKAKEADLVVVNVCEAQSYGMDSDSFDNPQGVEAATEALKVLMSIDDGLSVVAFV